MRCRTWWGLPLACLLAGVVWGTSASAQVDASAGGRVSRHIETRTATPLGGQIARAVGMPDVAADAPYARYTDPGQCDAMSVRLTKLYWRDKRADTLTAVQQRAALPPGVVDSVRLCLAHLPMATIPERSWPTVVHLDLLTGQTDSARAMTSRLIARAATHSVDAQARALYHVIEAYLSAFPVQDDAARTYVAQLDKLGQAAAVERVLVYSMLARYNLETGNVAAAIRDARTAWTAAGPGQMSSADRMDWLPEALTASEQLAEGTAIQSGSTAALAVLDSAQRVTFPLRDAGSSDQQQIHYEILRWETRYHIMGKTAAPIRDLYVFNAGTDTSALPRRGEVTLVLFTGIGGGAQFPAYAAIRHFSAKYGASGFRAVLIAIRQGSFLQQMVLDEAQESQDDRAWFLDYLHMPATLAVTPGMFNKLPDGRYVMARDPNDLTYPWVSNYIDATLVGRDGKVLLSWWLDQGSEVLFDATIQKAVAEK